MQGWEAHRGAATIRQREGRCPAAPGQASWQLWLLLWRGLPRCHRRPDRPLKCSVQIGHSMNVVGTVGARRLAEPPEAPGARPPPPHGTQFSARGRLGLTKVAPLGRSSPQIIGTLDCLCICWLTAAPALSFHPRHAAHFSSRAVSPPNRLFAAVRKGSPPGGGYPCGRSAMR